VDKVLHVELEEMERREQEGGREGVDNRV